MIKKSTILLVLALLFTSGCVERGQSIHPSVPTYSSKKPQVTKDVQPAYVLRITTKNRKIDSVQNTISGTLMLVIGLMILL